MKQGHAGYELVFLFIPKRCGVAPSRSPRETSLRASGRHNLFLTTKTIFMKRMIPLLIISAGMMSCHHVYYAPNTANAPMLSEKGETRVNALYSTGMDSEFDAFEFQFARAVSGDMGIMVNGFTGGKSEKIPDYYGNSADHMESGNGSYIELAGGYFRSLDERKRWIAEVYGGTGFGFVKSDYGFRDYSKVGVTKFFIQPSMGYKAPHFELALVPKISYVNWRVKQDKITSQESQEARDDMQALRTDPSFFAFEPALLLRGGGKNFKLQAALSICNFKSSTSSYADHLAESVNLSLGVSINIKPKKK
jgi:hypothetical protein